MRTTIKDIARKLNLAHTTVSRILNSKKDFVVSDKVRELVLQTAREMDYHPNQAARAMVTGHTNMTALWTAYVYPTYYAYTIHCIGRAINQYGYDLQIVETNNQMNPDHIIPSSLSWPVNGIILFQNPWYVDEYLKTISSLKSPAVSMGPHTNDRFDHVKIDLRPGAVKAIQHFIESGRRHIAFFTKPDCIAINDMRYQAYCEVMNDAGLELEIIQFACTNSVYERDKARSAMLTYLEDHDCPDAMFFDNDESAIGAYRALRDLGKHIPDDVALIGCDGIADTLYHDPTLSSIVQPIQEMCELASNFLNNRIENPDIAQQQAVLEAELVLRESS